MSNVISEESIRKPTKLRRSESDRSNHESKKVIFHDSMALRSRVSRGDSRITFKDLERLDGLPLRTRKVSPEKPRPNQPPPPPPPVNTIDFQEIENKTKSIKEPNRQVSDENEIFDKTLESQKNEVKVDNTNNGFFISTPPSAPPRKRSNNKSPGVNIVPSNDGNKTVVQINGIQMNSVHKLQIKNQFSDCVQTVSVLDNPQRKTSIMITGDDCYSTVVNDDVPLYQSSVVVKDSPTDSTFTHNTKKSSSVYITGNFIIAEPITQEIQNKEPEKAEKTPQVLQNCKKDDENNSPSSDRLKELLRDPVEAVKRNLVPHVCGKSDVSRRQRDLKLKDSNFIETSPVSLEDSNNIKDLLEDSFLKLRNYESVGDDLSSEHSSSTQYEFVDASSECYTDHSNRSSVTEDELGNRTKFYELLADSALVEVSENEDHHYESIKVNPDPIYEEIEIPPPLPSNPPPSSLLDDLHLDKEYTTR